MAAGILVVGTLAAAAPPARAADSGAEARSVLKSMATYLEHQKTIEFTFDSSIEVITPTIEKIQYTSSGQAFVDRPDKLRVQRRGGTGELDLYFDGKSATLYGPGIKTYARIPGLHSIDQLIDALERQYGFAGPGADLLLSNAYQALTANVQSARYLGVGVVGGVTCDHVAFRNKETDWQVWVQIGPQAIPRKYVIISKTLAAAPEYSVVIRDWKTGMTIKPASFAFKPPADAKRGTVGDLSGLDEYPHALPSGGYK
jgi:hypothetical protein